MGFTWWQLGTSRLITYAPITEYGANIFFEISVFVKPFYKPLRKNRLQRRFWIAKWGYKPRLYFRQNTVVVFK